MTLFYIVRASKLISIIYNMYSAQNYYENEELNWKQLFTYRDNKFMMFIFNLILTFYCVIILIDSVIMIVKSMNYIKIFIYIRIKIKTFFYKNQIKDKYHA